jgi:FkbM family methyltransferase
VPDVTVTVNDGSPFGHHEPRGTLARLIKFTRAPRSGWLGRRAAFVGRALGIAMLRGRPLDVNAFGAKMRLYPAHNVSEKNLLFTPHLFDPEERRELAKRITGGFVFIDIGANVGGYSLFVAALAGPHARVLAIEPQPEIFERLVFNVRQNPFGTVKALECAIADRDGPITLFVDPANRGETSMRYVNLHGERQAVRAQAKTLQAVLAEEKLDRIDALKIDVEGAEDLILESFFAEAPASLWPKLLLVDSASGRIEVGPMRLAQSGDYRLVLRTRRNCFFERVT